jgi:hypothetical protein
MQERTTKELIETLGEDFDRCYRNILQSFDEGTIDDKGLLDADYEFHARQLIRAAFAYIEGVTFSVKITHPRMPEDLDVSPDELLNAIKAKQGFDEILMHYARKKSKLPQKRRKK